MAATLAKDKYFLRSLHEEIGLYDRKLAHLMKYETFASEKERNVAAAKLSVKRGQLIRNAQQLVEEGVEYKVSDLPRSIRTEEQLAAEALAAEEQKAPAAEAAPTERSLEPSIYDSSALNFRNEINEYIENRRKLTVLRNLTA